MGVVTQNLDARSRHNHTTDLHLRFQTSCVLSTSSYPNYVIRSLNHAGRRAFEPSQREPSPLCTITLDPNSLTMKNKRNNDNGHAYAVALPMHDAEMKDAVCLLSRESL